MPLDPATPTLAMLDLFLSVVERGSITAAAAAHGLSQPAASSAMGRLERRVGVPLLRRTPAGTVPTAAGRRVAAWADELVRAAARFSEEVADLRGDVGGHLTVAASLTIAEYLLPGWLTAFRSRWSDVAVQLAVENSADVTAAVLSGGADLGFVEDVAVDARLSSRVVAHDELVVVVAPGHAWARRRTPVALPQLAAAPLVVREQGSGTRHVLDELLAPHRPARPPRPLLELGSTTAVREAVRSGVGPAALSRLAVDGELAAGRLVTVELTGGPLLRELHAVWPSGTPLVGPAGALVDAAVHRGASDGRQPPGGG